MRLAEHPVATQTPLHLFVSRARLIGRFAEAPTSWSRGYGTQSGGTLTLVAWHDDASRYRPGSPAAKYSLSRALWFAQAWSTSRVTASWSPVVLEAREKAKQLLGFEATTSLREGLQRVIDWRRARGIGTTPAVAN